MKFSNSIGTGAKPALPPPPPPAHRVRLSRRREGDLIYEVKPEYPSLARSARIQGPVVLQAVISLQGMIENLRVPTGHPMSVRAAIDAVIQRRDRSYVLNNEPVEVEMQITVNFLSFRKLERDRSFVTPIFNARIMRE